jgi:phosphomevalonate kinase
MTETRPEPHALRNAQLIAISGKQYTGKDLLADLLIERLPDFKKVPLAWAIKEEFAKRHGLTLAEVEANKAHYRPGLIELGNWGRSQDPDYWLKQVLSQPGKKIISDMRLKREYDLLKAKGAFLIRLEATREIRARRGNIVSENDPTERELDAVTEWDLMLENNASPEALATKITSYL